MSDSPEQPQVQPVSIIENPNYFEVIRVGNIQKVSMSGITKNPEEPSQTHGANPCFAGALTSRKTNGIYVFHSNVEILPDELKRLIDEKELQGGIIGGNKISIDKNLNILNLTGAKIILPPIDDFNASFAVYANPYQRVIEYAYNLRINSLIRSTQRN